MAKAESLYITCTFITHGNLFVKFPAREREAREESSIWDSHAVPDMAPARVERLPPHCVVVALLVRSRAGVDISYGIEPSGIHLRNRRREIDHHTIRSYRWL
jgi:hypothetical protein